MSHLVIDPVTRVGGPLRIEADVEAGKVGDAWVAATMYRGIEWILEGRDAHDAPLLASRVCGSCAGIHALAAARALERAVGATIPQNARLVRNILAGTQLVLDDVLHFYTRQAFDWVDLEQALLADEIRTSHLATALGDWPNSTSAHFKNAKIRLAGLRTDAGGGLMANGPWGHPAYRLQREANLMIAAHALEALDWGRALGRLRVMLGGKDPHPQTFILGGMALAVPWGGPPPGGAEHPRQIEKTAPPALSAGGLDAMAKLLTDARTFVEQAFLPDVIAIARTYPEWIELGAGNGIYLAGGEFPEDDSATPRQFMPGGRTTRESLMQVDPVIFEGIAENTAHSWYDDDPAAARNPVDGVTKPAYSGPAMPYEKLSDSDRYSWLKAPRYSTQPAEVGPLARILIARVQGSHEVASVIDRVVSSLDVGPDALFGTWGRLVARAIEAQALASRLQTWVEQLRGNIAVGDLAIADLSRWDGSTWERESSGWSLGEGPAGAVAHWVSIRDGRIQRYQIVDGTTWNASPRCVSGRRGPIEQALIGTPVVDAARPLELLRTVHSFDPCPTCGVH
jgi:Ni,Fe-hydrogenase I large subunit